LALFAGIGAAITLWFTAQRHQLDRDANRTDRYTKAVEQLGDDAKPAVQLGGVYALERVAIDSLRDRAVAFDVLSAFVRQQQAQSKKVSSRSVERSDGFSDEMRGPTMIAEPVLAALTVLTRRPPQDLTYPPPDLGGAHLPDVRLSFAQLGHANLREADLTNANLTNAKLRAAYLIGAMLTKADLSGADLSGADLSGADLSGAYLSGVRGITDEDLRALMDRTRRT
jgi:hypothetical protein